LEGEIATEALNIVVCICTIDKGYFIPDIAMQDVVATGGYLQLGT